MVWFVASRLAALDDGTPLAQNAATVMTVLSAYKGTARLSLSDETEKIYGLEHDLAKSDAIRAAVAALNLGPFLTELYATNRSLAQAYTARANARAGRIDGKGGETTDTLRKAAAALIIDICRRVNAINTVLPSDEAAAAAVALFGVVKQYKLVASQGGKRKKEDPEPEPEPEPESAKN